MLSSQQATTETHVALPTPQTSPPLCCTSHRPVRPMVTPFRSMGLDLVPMLLTTLYDLEVLTATSLLVAKSWLSALVGWVWQETTSSIYMCCQTVSLVNGPDHRYPNERWHQEKACWWGNGSRELNLYDAQLPEYEYHVGCRLIQISPNYFTRSAGYCVPVPGNWH